MITTDDPETMTAEERRLEVASILATGLLRCLRRAKAASSDPRQQSPPNGLDLPSKTRLSVAQRPAS